MGHYGTEGREFESLRARKKGQQTWSFLVAEIRPAAAGLVLTDLRVVLQHDAL
jgi:hypothetical protein